MNSLVSGLIVLCILSGCANPSFSEENGKVIDPQPVTSSVEQHQQEVALSDLGIKPENVERSQAAQGRSLDDEKKSKPLRTIFMGIYKNYKSTYLGNKTLTEYKQTLRETMKNKQEKLKENESIQGDEEKSAAEEDEQYEGEQPLPTVSGNINDADEAVVTDDPEIAEEDSASPIPSSTLSPEREEISTELPTKRKRKTNAKKKDSPNKGEYHLGPALNMSLDLDNSIVKVNLDGESLKELVTGRWLSDTSEEGRGKKYEMVTRILPLFILPFLIQSAIVPFLVTKLKLLLMKSMLVGKLAIFLLIISAFKNSNKPMQTYEVAPSYWAGEPSRRSEIAAAASSMAYNGYRVEGKPAAWVN
ncbi:osiris 22 [Haematobia irritans]|uniref:osiris 22 n=1 Tax=Haematobia irritans TaxID=7368 RepID=UPI003F508F84